MLTKGAIGNLINRYRAVLKKCHLMNTFGSLAVASMLVLGGAGAADARYYELQNVTPSDPITSLEAGKDRVLGGWRNAANVTAPIESNFTINDGNYNMVVGGSYIGDANGEITVKSTEVTINGGTFHQVVGGNGGSDNKKLFLTGDEASSKITISNGTFGADTLNTNCPELLVIGGNLFKDGSQEGNNDHIGADGALKSVTTTISGGTFKSAVIGGSASIQYYGSTGDIDHPDPDRHGLKNTVEKATLNITGGTFTDAIVGGGLAYGWHTTSTVDEVEMNISGVKLEEGADIYAGGMIGNQQQSRWEKDENGDAVVRTIATVGNAVVNIKNAEVNNIYGMNGQLTQATGKAPVYTAITDPDNAFYAAVKTDLTLTDASAVGVYLPEGTLALNASIVETADLAKGALIIEGANADAVSKITNLTTTKDVDLNVNGGTYSVGGVLDLGKFKSVTVGDGSGDANSAVAEVTKIVGSGNIDILADGKLLVDGTYNQNGLINDANVTINGGYDENGVAKTGTLEFKGTGSDSASAPLGEDGISANVDTLKVTGNSRGIYGSNLPGSTHKITAKHFLVDVELDDGFYSQECGFMLNGFADATISGGTDGQGIAANGHEDVIIEGGGAESSLTIESKGRSALIAYRGSNVTLTAGDITLTGFRDAQNDDKVAVDVRAGTLTATATDRDLTIGIGKATEASSVNVNNGASAILTASKGNIAITGDVDNNGSLTLNAGGDIAITGSIKGDEASSITLEKGALSVADGSVANFLGSYSQKAGSTTITKAGDFFGGAVNLTGGTMTAHTVNADKLTLGAATLHATNALNLKDVNLAVGEGATLIVGNKIDNAIGEDPAYQGGAIDFGSQGTITVNGGEFIADADAVLNDGFEAPNGDSIIGTSGFVKLDLAVKDGEAYKAGEYTLAQFGIAKNELFADSGENAELTFLNAVVKVNPDANVLVGATEANGVATLGSEAKPTEVAEGMSVTDMADAGHSELFYMLLCFCGRS